jgi:hypothetical protein
MCLSTRTCPAVVMDSRSRSRVQGSRAVSGGGVSGLFRRRRSNLPAFLLSGGCHRPTAFGTPSRRWTAACGLDCPLVAPRFRVGPGRAPGRSEQVGRRAPSPRFPSRLGAPPIWSTWVPGLEEEADNSARQRGPSQDKSGPRFWTFRLTEHRGGPRGGGAPPGGAARRRFGGGGGVLPTLARDFGDSGHRECRGISHAVGAQANHRRPIWQRSTQKRRA